jgi:hypothetical protein
VDSKIVQALRRGRGYHWFRENPGDRDSRRGRVEIAEGRGEGHCGDGGGEGRKKVRGLQRYQK